MGKHSAPVDHRARRVGTVAVMAGGSVLAPAVVGAIPSASADVLDVIAKCESGSNPLAKNPYSSASGLFQILNSTWAANGGMEFAPTARQASPAQQRVVAERILARSGTTPWNASRSCWAGKVNAPHVGTSVVPPTHQVPTPHIVVREGTVPMAPNSYTVVRGDCLSTIARRFGISVVDLYNANRNVIGGNINLILPNQVLTINGAHSTGTHVNSAPQHAAPFEAPLHSMVVTQPFRGLAHQGIDLHAAMGTPGYAVADGVIKFARPASGFGLWVVERAQIDGLTVDFVYGHLNHLMVHEGEPVRAGDQIINTGNGGGVVPHLHFGINIGGVEYGPHGGTIGHYIDPIGWLHAHGVGF